MEAPEELVTAGSKTPSPKTRAVELVKRCTDQSLAVSVQMGPLVSLAYSHANESPFRPRISGISHMLLTKLLLPVDDPLTEFTLPVWAYAFEYSEFLFSSFALVVVMLDSPVFSVLMNYLPRSDSETEQRYADSLAADVVPCNMAPRDCLEVHEYAVGSADPTTE